MKTLHSMDMEKFMLAMGESGLVEKLRESFARDIPMPSALMTAKGPFLFMLRPVSKPERTISAGILCASHLVANHTVFVVQPEIGALVLMT